MGALVPGPHVDEEVLVEGVASVELLAAVVTLVDQTLLVTHPMVVEAVLGQEALATFLTEVRTALWVINLVVKATIVGAVKNFVAHFADKALLALLAVRCGEMSTERLPRLELFLANLTGMLGVLHNLILLLLVL